MRMSNILALLLIMDLVCRESVVAQNGWQQMQSGTTRSLYGMLNSVDYLGKIWVVGENGLILASTDFGQSFSSENSHTTSDLYDMELMEMSPGGLCAVGANGTILRTTNPGTNWVVANSGTSVSLRAIMNGYAVGDSGIVLLTTDSGISWTNLNQPLRVRLNDVFDDFGARTISVGDSGTIVRYNVPTNTWTTLESGTKSNLISIHTVRKTIGGSSYFGYVVVGDSGIILSSTNTGSTWTREHSNTTVALRGVFETGPFGQERLWTCGVGGEILSSVNEGAEWSSFPSPVTNSLRAVSFGTPHHGVNAFTGFMVGDGGAVLRFFGATTEVSPYPGSTVSAFVLQQNYPNPFNPSTTIKFQLPSSGHVVLAVYELLGKVVALLVNEQLTPGSHEVTIDGTQLSSGLYFYRLQAGGFVQTKKLILLR